MTLARSQTIYQPNEGGVGANIRTYTSFKPENVEKKDPNVDLFKDRGAFAPTESKCDGLWGRSFANCRAVTSTVDL